MVRKRSIAIFCVFQIALFSGLFGAYYWAKSASLPDEFLPVYTPPEGVPQITVILSQADLEKFAGIRERTLERGFSIDEGRDHPVSGAVVYNNSSLPAKIRLGGSNVDHYQGIKWTLHIDLKGEQTLFGKNSFGLMAPPTRGVFYEQIFDDHLAEEDIMHEVYEYADVTINKRHIGLMLVEKTPDAELQKRADGALAKGIAAGKVSVGYYHLNSTHPFHWLGYSAVAKDKKNPELASLARSMLRAFQLGTLSASEVFDVEVLGRYLAIAELWGTWHAVEWGDMRFYLNPQTLKLEPIGKESGIELWWIKNGGPTMQAAMHLGASPAEAFLADDKIRAAFVRNLQRMTQDEYVAHITSLLQEKENHYRRILSTEYKTLPVSPLTIFKKRVELLRSVDESNVLSDPHQLPYSFFAGQWQNNPVPRRYPKPSYYPIRALVHKIVNDGAAYLEFNNSLPWLIPDAPDLKLSLNVTKVMIKTDKGEQLLDGVPYPFTLENGKPVYVHSRLISDSPNGDISGTIYGSIGNQPEDSYAFTTYDMEAPLKKHPLSRPSMDEVLAAHPFLEQHDDALRIKSGTWQVTTPLILPDNVRLEVEEGTTLVFSEASYLSASAAIILKGTAEHPVILTGGDGKPWKGIAVMRAATESLLQHTIISNTTFTHIGVWKLTGGITFYESAVHIADSVLTGSTAEDTLNIVRSKFLIENTKFSHSHSDALDSDFSQGMINNCRFENIGSDEIGGDAVDLSDSQVDVLNSSFSNIKDKGISAGERTRVHVSGMALDKAGMGVASKDSSVVNIEHSNFAHTVHAVLIAYEKKPLYSGGSIYAKDIGFVDNVSPVMVQSDSQITLDGKEMPANSKDTIDRILWKVYRYDRYAK